MIGLIVVKEFFQRFRASLPTTVVKLGWISFWADVCSEMAYPILPLFLVGSLGAPTSLLTLIEGTAEATVSFFKGWSGFASDKRGARLPYIQVGYALSAISKPLIGIASGWGFVFGARILDRIGKGTRTSARDALISESIEKSQYGHAFGFHRAMDTAGAAVGVVLCLVLLCFFPADYRLILLLAGIPGVLSVLIALRLKDPHQTFEQAGPKPRPKIAWSELSPVFWVALVATALFSFANTSDMLLILRAREIGALDTQIIWMYILFNVIAASLSSSCGKLSDTFGRTNTIVLGWTVFIVSYALFAVGSFPAIWSGFALYGVSAALGQGVARALVAELAPVQARATLIGYFWMICGFGTLFGNIVAGLVWERASSQVALGVSAAVAFIALLLLLVGMPVLRRIRSR